MSAILVGLLVALMAMPANLGELAGGSFTISITPLVLTAGFAYGLIAVSSKLVEAKAVWRQTNRYLLAFLLLAALSTAWSIDPGATQLIRMSSGAHSTARDLLREITPARAAEVWATCGLPRLTTATMFTMHPPCPASRQC